MKQRLRGLSRCLMCLLVAGSVSAACSTDFGGKNFSDAGPDTSKEPNECDSCEAPKFCLDGMCVEAGTPMIEADIGGEPGEFGVNEPQEANPTAPMSLAASADGEQVFVLDQENGRVQTFEGTEVVKHIPIPHATVQDLALLENGHLALLDRHLERLIIIDQAGEIQSEIDLPGPGIPQGGRASGVYTRDNGIWVKADRYFVRVMGSEGSPVSRRQILFGELSRDGKDLISLNLLGDGSLHVVKRPAEGLPTYVEAHVRFERRASYVLASDTDAEGNLYVATDHIWQDGDTQQSEARLTVLSSELKVERDEILAPYMTGREMFRSVAVSSDGQVFQLDVKEDRVLLRRY